MQAKLFVLAPVLLLFNAVAGEVPSLYADGLLCSMGCRPAGAQFGWLERSRWAPTRSYR